MPDIFLSYTREDQAAARRFARGFEAEGLNVWWDTTLRAGEAYDQVTEKALKEAKAVVVLWSKRSVESRWVRAEATIGDRNKTLVPAMIESCERPIMFELTQTAELVHWQVAHDDKAWLAFLADVRRFVERDRSAIEGAQTPVGGSTPAPALAAITVAPAKLGERGGAPSLAVLPFANRSGLAEDEVFAIGMVEDVIDALSQGVNVRVISSSATARFRTGAIPDLEAMARQLGVRYILEGNVRRSGANLRVTAQLVEATSGAILWTQKFDRPLTELAQLQEELVLEVASHLDAQVNRIEMERALKKPSDLTAWEAVQRAFAYLRHISRESNLLATQEAERAVSIAPDYAAGHAILATHFAVGHHYFSADDPVQIARIRQHVERAAALGSNDAVSLGYVAQALSLAGFPQEALRHAERASALSHGMAFAYHARGTACILLDRSDEGISHFGTEMKFSPGADIHYICHTWHANAQIRLGRWPEAVAAVDRALALNPAFMLALFGKAFLCARAGNMVDAHAWFQKARQAEPDLALEIWQLRLQRRFANNPIAQDAVACLLALWAETGDVP